MGNSSLEESRRVRTEEREARAELWSALTTLIRQVSNTLELVVEEYQEEKNK